ARTLVDKTKDLKEVKLEQVYNQLTQWRSGAVVLVESEREAKIVPSYDLWVRPVEDNSFDMSEDRMMFNGEAAISSAILQLTKPDKTAVIFVRYGGEPLLRPDMEAWQQRMDMRNLPRAPFGQLNNQLEKANFVTADWNVQAEKTPPVVENASRRIYVVMPPTPPERNPAQPMMPPQGMSAADRQVVLDAVKASGTAMFLAGWQQPQGPMGGGAYDYGEFLKTEWGIDVRASDLVLQFTPFPDRKGEWAVTRQSQFLTTDEKSLRFTEHDISRPSRTDRGAFVMAAPLEVAKPESRPAGVRIDPLVEVNETPDVWAVADVFALQQKLRSTKGVTPTEQDIRAPFPIAVAAERTAGGAASAPADGKVRVVVVGSDAFIRDEVAQASMPMVVGNNFVFGQLYPANSDFFMNSLHWLAGDAERIAAGPRRGELPRLKDLTEEKAAVLPYLLVGVWPALALVLGAGVWLVRRK
ncbi:MAG: hypothetical protein AB1716_10990, partial [Planctomycetota bacterium]